MGAGLIGQGWATLFSAYGHPVIMQDLTKAHLTKARQLVQSNLEQLEASHHLEGQTAESARNLVRYTLDIEEAVKQADFVVESVPDNYDNKKQVFKQIDRLTPSSTILASSSSGLLMSEIQSGVIHPERCVIAHPFLPVHLIPLVEVVGGEQTNMKTIEKTCRILKDIGKTPVRLKKEVPGYIVNRLQTAVFREAVDLVVNGVASAAEVDRAFCNGMGMRDPFIGPLMRAHLTADGIDHFFERYGDSNEMRLQTMATWKAFSTDMKDILVKSVNEIPVLRNNSLNEIKVWRDERLMKILALERQVPES